MDLISTPLGYLMRFCYQLLNNYGLAIILFTLITKIILLPVSLWTHNNSIKVIKIEPALNRVKAKYFGDKDRISDAQLELYKKEKYNPFAGIIPMIIQIFLLICLIRIIYNPLTHLLHIDQTTIDMFIKNVCVSTGADSTSSSIQLTVVDAIQKGIVTFDSSSVVTSISNLDMSFLGFDLTATPLTAKGIMLLVPLFAGLSAFLLSVIQNRLNPLQAEQGSFGKISTMALSVGISLILGGFVPAGIGFYWICSNISTVFVQLILNVIINPKKAIDYDELNESKKELEKLQSLGSDKNIKFGDELYKREKSDYKRFFSIANKHIVFYSESNGFYKYFENLIVYLLEHSNITIHYITSDPNDNIFEMAKSNERIKPYFFGEKKLITVFMKMDADIVVMTMPDIENFHYKRSYVRKDIEYIYMFHYPLSTHMVLNHGALDNYDTIFCVGEFQFDEIRKQEQIYNLKEKNLISYGYGQLEKLQKSYDSMEKINREKKKILIAPSWQYDNILDTCIYDILDNLLGKGYEVHVRPHPEYVKRYKSRMDAIVEHFASYSGDDLVFELDFTGNNSIYDSDIVITDWSGTAYEFSFVTLKPSIFIDTTPKINNEKYEELGIEPLELKLRGEIGEHFSPKALDRIGETVDNMISQKEKYSNTILEIRNKYIANYGSSASVGGKYIIKRIIAKGKSSKKEE